MYHSHYDLNAEANGGATPMYTGNGTFRSGHYNEYVPSSPLPVPQPGQFAYKEFLRQTMLRHEVAFKDQVEELHRLYRRQKELMSEIKSKELYMNHLQLEVQSSNSSSAKITAICGQNTPHRLPFISSHYRPSSIARDNIQTSLTSLQELKPSATPAASQNGGTLNNQHFAESKGKKIKGKLLDLELPAEVYMDSDEEESFEDAEFSKTLTPAALSSNKRSKVVVDTYVIASTAKRSLGPVLQGEIFSPCSFSGTKTTLADLNEPLTTSFLEDSGGDKKINSCLEIPERNHHLSNSRDSILDVDFDELKMKSLAPFDKARSEVVSASSGRKPSYNLGQNPLVVQALPSFDNQLSYSKGARICGRQRGPIHNKVDASRVMKSLRSSCSSSKPKESLVCMSSRTPELNCFDLNSAVTANSEITPGDASSTRKFTEVEIVNKSKRCRMIDINLPCDPMTDEEPLIDDSVGHDHEKSGQLSFCVDDDSLDKAPLEIDLEAPISPEVEERPPPRGDSEENQPEEGCDHLGELAKIAAETIVSISSFKSISYQESINMQECEASDSGDLEWFAGLVYSLSTDLENNLETINWKDTSSIDDFEAMTLELPEMKAEDYWCKNDIQISSDTCSMLLPCQTRKGRTRRSKRKDFQREVLPTLASLSRYEVTEDIQMIEGLMEAAGTPWHLSRTRRAGRMGRKPRVAKQQTFDEEVPELRTLISWGKVKRRPRGRRSPASPIVLSKWLEYAV